MSMRLWPRTLSAQLIVVTALAVLVSNAGVAVWFASTREQETESALTERLLDRAASAATLLSGIPAKEREATARTMSAGPWRFNLIYGKPAGQPMADDEARLAERLRALLPPERAKQPVVVRFTSARLPTARMARLQGSPFGPVVEMTLPVVRNTELVVTFFRPAAEPWPTQIMIAALVAIIVTSAAAAFVARRVTQPLRELAAAASVAARGGSAQRVSEEGPDDIRRAAHAFNAMNDQVRRTLESHRHLLSAVGHDLRTPITAMRISTEFVSDAEVRERLEKNLTELQELTEAVLDAARGAGFEQMRRIDLAALIESLCADLEEMGEPVTWTAHEAAPFTCRPNEIRRAVRNLVQNAIAYGKTANVVLTASPSSYEIAVEDDGPGIADADRERVFEPFVRLEASRSAETGGSGLGLTLVKAIAEGHGGGITLENRPGGGLRATLHLPREGSA
ncbi:MAG TPA: ATP-binding protein [Rhizomicrobium sp.]|nr:ATP-binding protein [Rhizomicrobium sp.]